MPEPHVSVQGPHADHSLHPTVVITTASVGTSDGTPVGTSHGTSDGTPVGTSHGTSVAASSIY